MSNRQCFGNGNIDTVCETCWSSEDCQKVIQEKVIGITKAATAINTAELEQLLDTYKKQCVACETAFMLKTGSNTGSNLRIQFAREIGKREMLEKILEEVFSVSPVTLEGIHDRATTESKGVGRYDPERL